MEISIKDSKEMNEIKIDDKKLTNVISYSLSSDVDTVMVTLVLEFPKNKVNIQADY